MKQLKKVYSWPLIKPSRGKLIMRRIAFIAVTIMIMLAISRFLVRIVDATVQIDDDIGMLVLMLIVVNAVIGGSSYLLYRNIKR